MRDNPCNLYRPARLSDGQGGWTASWVQGVLVYGYVHIEGFSTLFVARAEEDIQQEDVLEIEGRFWRVLLKSYYAGGPNAAWKIEMCDRPQVAPTTTGAGDLGTTTGAP